MLIYLYNTISTLRNVTLTLSLVPWLVLRTKLHKLHSTPQNNELRISWETWGGRFLSRKVTFYVMDDQGSIPGKGTDLCLQFHVHTGPGANHVSRRTRTKRPEREAHLSVRLSMLGTSPPLPHTSSCHGAWTRRQFYFLRGKVLKW
jgi:hypothetical protein